jgi:hypothetical protein
MKKLLLFLLAAVMMCSLAACGTGNGNGNGGEASEPPEGWAAEYTILVGGSDEWTPYSGKGGVTFSNANNKVIDGSDDGTTIEFTGKEVGEAVITAALDGKESNALVRVRVAQVGASSEETTPPPMAWPGSPVVRFTPEPNFAYNITDY